MQSLYPNRQKAIAGQCFIMDSWLTTRSRRAFKKIRNWKTVAFSEESELHFEEEFKTLIGNSFFHVVTNKFILEKEKSFARPLQN